MARIPTAQEQGLGSSLLGTLPTRQVPVRPFFQDASAATAQAFGAGIGQALQGAGAAAQGTGETLVSIAADIQLEQTEREAKEADIAYSKRIREIMFGSQDAPGFYGLEGKGAVEAQEAAEAAIQRAREEIAEGLSNDRARQMFNQTSAVRLNQELERSAVHGFQQGKVAAQDASEARRAEFIDDGVARYNDPKARLQALEAGTDEVINFELDRGTDPEVVASRAEEYRSLFHESIIERIVADGDYTAATAYFDENKDDIDGRRHTAILDAIASGSTAQLAQVKREVREEIVALNKGQGSENLEALRAQVDAIPVGLDPGFDAGLRQDLYDAIADAPVISEYMKKPLAEVEDFLASFRARLSSADPTDRPSIDELRQFEKIDKAFADHRKLFNDGDGLIAAQNQGVIPRLPAIDFNDPEVLGQYRDAATAATDIYGIEISPLPSAAVDAFIDTVTGEGEPTPPAVEDVQVMMANVRNIMGEDAAAFMVSDIVEKQHPEVALALQISADDPRVAQELIKGGRFLRDNPEFKIADRDMRERSAEVYGNLFTEDTIQAQGPINDAAEALYAIRAAQQGISEYDPEVHRQAIMDVTGGIVQHNGRNIIPPSRGMEQDDFDALMREVNNTALMDEAGNLPRTADGEDFTADMLRSSIWRDEGVLVSTSLDGTYNIMIPGVGYIEAADGSGAYELDLRTAFDTDKFVAGAVSEFSFGGPDVLPPEVEAELSARIRNEVRPEEVVEPEELVAGTSRGGPPPARTFVPGETDPRGIRNNNPGNIERNDITWQGMADEQGDKRFVTFAHPKFGIRAMTRVLRNYQAIHGLNTVGDIIGRWAPASENDTRSYINTVANSLNVKPDQPINVYDDEVMFHLVNAIIQHENGVQPYSERTIRTGIALER